MTRQSLDLLRRFVRRLVTDRVATKDAWFAWKKSPEHEAFMEPCFAYSRQEGMPSVTALVQPFFHGELPLLGLNYTQVAHVTLHRFAHGWTGPLRLCRGIVFDRRGSLVTFPFPKFFNYGEHQETRDLPDGPFEATVKEDGHLAIIFRYRDRLIATTRGSFTSRSSVLANQLLDAYRERWASVFPERATVLAEFIHPETKVIVDYQGSEEFALLASYSHRTLRDLDYPALTELGTRLGIRVAQRWTGSSLGELLALVKNTEFLNKEGFVARFADGRRVKFKFAGYVGRMIAEKLTYRYVMQRLTEGSLEAKLADLPFEVRDAAGVLVEELVAAASVPGDKKERLKNLYELAPEDERTDYHKSVCRRFYTWLESSGRLARTA